MSANQENSITSSDHDARSVSEGKAALTSPTPDKQGREEPKVESGDQKGTTPQEVSGSGGALTLLPPMTVGVAAPPAPASGADIGGGSLPPLTIGVAAPPAPASGADKGGASLPPLTIGVAIPPAPALGAGKGGSSLPPLTIGIAIPPAPASGGGKSSSQSQVPSKSKVKALVDKLEKARIANSK